MSIADIVVVLAAAGLTGLLWQFFFGARQTALAGIHRVRPHGDRHRCPRSPGRASLIGWQEDLPYLLAGVMLLGVAVLVGSIGSSRPIEAAATRTQQPRHLYDSDG